MRVDLTVFRDDVHSLPHAGGVDFTAFDGGRTRRTTPPRVSTVELVENALAEASTTAATSPGGGYFPE